MIACNRIILGLLVCILAMHTRQSAPIDAPAIAQACACIVETGTCACGDTCPCNAAPTQAPPDTHLPPPSTPKQDWHPPRADAGSIITPPPGAARTHPAIAGPQPVRPTPAARARPRFCIWVL